MARVAYPDPHWDRLQPGPGDVRPNGSSQLERGRRKEAAPKEAGAIRSFGTDFLLGGTSGMVAKTITAPIERIKLVVQTQDANPRIRSGEVARYKGIRDCAVRLYNEQGIVRFWDGNFTNCMRYFPTQAFNLAFKDSFKKVFPKYDPKREFRKFFGANLASGGAAAACSLCIVYPLDYARTRLATDVGSGGKTFSGLLNCITRTAQGPGGVLALYNGFGVAVVGIVFYRGLQLGCFDTITGLNPWRSDKGALGAASQFAAAQAAVTIGAGASYPFDTVRRRLQMQAEKPQEQRLYQSGIHCFSRIASEEGFFQGLYKGFGANVLRSVGGALVLVFYERSKNYLGLDHDSR